jgi:hypothetical protein
MSTRNFSGEEEVRLAHKTENFSTASEPIVYETVGSSTSHYLTGLHGLLQGQLYFTCFTCLKQVYVHRAETEELNTDGKYFYSPPRFDGLGRLALFPVRINLKAMKFTAVKNPRTSDGPISNKVDTDIM